MKVVLADIDEPAVMRLGRDLAAQGAEILAVPTDVSRADDVETLAHKAFETFSDVHLLFNNAGVGPGRAAWENTLQDWAWGLGVNLWGVIYGIHFFVPRMLEQRTDGHVVNTASMAGLISGPGQSIYKVAKHGVVTLSETLYHDLRLRGARLQASVLCPGWVDTGILEAERHRPARLKTATPVEDLGPQGYWPGRMVARLWPWLVDAAIVPSSSPSWQSTGFTWGPCLRFCSPPSRRSPGRSSRSGASTRRASSPRSASPASQRGS